jgi:hypothetical protein
VCTGGGKVDNELKNIVKLPCAPARLGDLWEPIGSFSPDTWVPKGALKDLLVGRLGT